ncbi:MAG: alpha-amylase family glycosyl hydrolase [Bdellovibrionales bacterium]
MRLRRRQYLTLGAMVLTLAVGGAKAFAKDRSPSPPLSLKPGAVIYGVVPPLFGDGNAFDAVIGRLDHLQRQGVDALWLSPVNTTDDPGFISYAVTDYFSIREDFGGESGLRRLIEAAHSRDMKVLMDFVPNHTSNAHPYFMDSEEKGTASPYYRYYDRDADGQVQHYFDWAHLPNLNFANFQVVRWIQRAFHHWLDQVGLDGYRVDVAWGVKERAPRFWRQLIQDLRKNHEDLIMLAEAGARDTYYYENGFDLAYDWTDELGVWAWREAFDTPAQTGALLAEAVAANPRAERVVRFLNNNDTGARFLSRYGERVTRVAAVLQHTLPGVPVLFTGDEVGAEYEPYEDPAPLSWEDRFQLKDLYRRLAELREQETALHAGRMIPIPVIGNPAALAYVRQSGPREWVLIVLNFGDAATLQLRWPKSLVSSAGSGFVDLLTGEEPEVLLSRGGRATMAIGSQTARVLKHW